MDPIHPWPQTNRPWDHDLFLNIHKMRYIAIFSSCTLCISYEDYKYDLPFFPSNNNSPLIFLFYEYFVLRTGLTVKIWDIPFLYQLMFINSFWYFKSFFIFVQFEKLLDISIPCSNFNFTKISDVQPNITNFSFIVLL